MNNLMNIIKRIFFSYIILYGYNLIAINFNLIIPINLITVGFITIFGVPSLIALVLLKIIVL